MYRVRTLVSFILNYKQYLFKIGCFNFYFISSHCELTLTYNVFFYFKEGTKIVVLVIFGIRQAMLVKVSYTL